MKFDDLLMLLDDKGWFDLATAVQLSGQPRAELLVQLHRWSKAGKVASLRRGMYALAPPYRRSQIKPAQLANEIYAPSYLSTYWALGFYALIPEKVVAYTSITSRAPKTFMNDFGAFSYRHVKPAFFFGYRRLEIDGASILLAEPEKALLDLWHLEAGMWNPARFSEMRFQNMELVDPLRLADVAARFRSPRLQEAVGAWSQWVAQEQAGTVEL
jgi:hypothetical protein